MPNYIQPGQLGRASCRQWSGWSLHYCSLVRNSDGHWNVPYANWNGSDWNCNANWLDNSWDADYRIVLLVTFCLFPTVRFVPNRFGFVSPLDFSSHKEADQPPPF